MLCKPYEIFANNKISIAIMDLEIKGFFPYDTNILSDIIRSKFIKSNEYKVIERNKINEILLEHNIIQSGLCVKEECLSKIGYFLNVQKIVFGSIGKIGRR